MTGPTRAEAAEARRARAEFVLRCASAGAVAGPDGERWFTVADVVDEIDRTPRFAALHELHLGNVYAKVQAILRDAADGVTEGDVRRSRMDSDLETGRDGRLRTYRWKASVRRPPTTSPDTTPLAFQRRNGYDGQVPTTPNTCRLCDSFIPASKRVCDDCANAPADYRDAFVPGRLVLWEDSRDMDPGKGDIWTTVYKGEILDDDAANGTVVSGLDLARVDEYLTVRCDQEVLKRSGCDDRLTLHKVGRLHAVHVSLLAIDEEAEAERLANR